MGRGRHPGVTDAGAVHDDDTIKAPRRIILEVSRHRAARQAKGTVLLLGQYSLLVEVPPRDVAHEADFNRRSSAINAALSDIADVVGVPIIREWRVRQSGAVDADIHRHERTSRLPIGSVDLDPQHGIGDDRPCTLEEVILALFGGELEPRERSAAGTGVMVPVPALVNNKFVTELPAPGDEYRLRDILPSDGVVPSFAPSNCGHAQATLPLVPVAGLGAT